MVSAKRMIYWHFLGPGIIKTMLIAFIQLSTPHPFSFYTQFQAAAVINSVYSILMQPLTLFFSFSLFSSTEPLEAFDDMTLTLTLPPGVTVHTIKWLSIWCDFANENFGEIFMPDDLVVPVYIMSMDMMVCLFC